MTGEQVKKVLEQHLTPRFDGAKVELVVETSEIYQKLVEDLTE